LGRKNDPIEMANQLVLKKEEEIERLKKQHSITIQSRNGTIMSAGEARDQNNNSRLLAESQVKINEIYTKKTKIGSGLRKKKSCI
jgi:hypothetical protein